MLCSRPACRTCRRCAPSSTSSMSASGPNARAAATAERERAHLGAEPQTRNVEQLAEMRVFVRAIERGTFAVAASDLGLTPSAVSKLIARLEGRLGVRLVNRTTRKLSLTPEGETYFQSGRQLVHALDSLEQEVAASA